jgi:hypothetical protein
MSASKRIDKMIAELGDWRGERLAEIRKVIHEVDPEVIEDWKWIGSPVWSHDGMYALANPHKGKVKLRFHHGLSSPTRRNSTSRCSAGTSGGQSIFARRQAGQDRAQCVAARGEYNTTHSVPKSRGSRHIRSPR